MTPPSTPVSVIKDPRWLAEWAPLAPLHQLTAPSVLGVRVQGGGISETPASLIWDTWAGDSFSHSLTPLGIPNAVYLAPDPDCTVTLTGNEPCSVVIPMAGVSNLTIMNHATAPVCVALWGDINQPVSVSVLHDQIAPVLVTSALRVGSGGNVTIQGVMSQSVCGVMDWTCQLMAPNAHVSIQGLHLGTDRSSLFTRSWLRHDCPDTTATQVVKSVGYGKSYSEYDGTVWVSHGAHGTDSTQRNPNLLLTSGARAVSKPQLRIYADDVTCGHGATVSQVSEDEWWYLRSRGLSRTEAYSLLIDAFIRDSIPAWGGNEVAFYLVLDRYLQAIALRGGHV